MFKRTVIIYLLQLVIINIINNQEKFEGVRKYQNYTNVIVFVIEFLPINT